MHIELSDKQAHVLINALDCFSRLGMGQLNCITDGITTARGEFIEPTVVERFIGPLKRELFGHSLHSSDGICSPKTGDNAKIAYDLQCVIREFIAKRDNHPVSSVWNGPPLHTFKKEPLAIVKP